MTDLEVHVVHDAHGRILAVAAVAHTVGADGLHRGVTPVPREGQFAARLTLSEEQLAAGPTGLIRGFEVDISAARPSLRSRSSPIRPA